MYDHNNTICEQMIRVKTPMMAPPKIANRTSKEPTDCSPFAKYDPPINGSMTYDRIIFTEAIKLG